MKLENFDDILEETIRRLSSLTPKELLGYAIEMEDSEARTYSRLAEVVERLSLRALFIKMSTECRNHERGLRALFQQLYPGEDVPKVDVPTVEAFEIPEDRTDYLGILECCMASELLSKRTYESLASVATDEEVRKLALALERIEEGHYEELKTVHELMTALEERGINPRDLKPGSYLFTDSKKARYFLMDFLGWDRSVFALIHENPRCFLDMFSGRVSQVLWVSKIRADYKVETIHPIDVPRVKKRIKQFVDEFTGGRGVVLVENLGYLATELGFRGMFDFVLYLKDLVTLNGCYLIATAFPDAFEKREWNLLTSELELIS